MGENFDIGFDSVPKQELNERSDRNIKTEYGDKFAKDVGVDLCEGSDSSLTTGKDEMLENEACKDLNDAANESLDSILDNFKGDTWGELSLDEQKKSIVDLADYVAADTGNKNPPEIVFRDDMPDGSYGGYSPDSNIIEINVNMLGDSIEAADTIAHEMWHAYQQQCALDPTSDKGQAYQEGFDNYISPEYDFEGYENQMVEAEARDYAQGFKDKLTGK